MRKPDMRMWTHARLALLAACAALTWSVSGGEVGAQQAASAGQPQPPATLQLPPDVQRTFTEPAAYVPDLRGFTAATSELRDVVDRLSLDRQAILRFYTIPGSPERRARLRGFYEAWLAKLPEVPFDKLSREGQVDAVLLRNYLEYQLKLLGREERAAKETAPLLPFADAVVKLQEDRQKLRFVSGRDAQAALSRITDEARQARTALEKALQSGTQASRPAALTAVRAAQQIDRLRNALEAWFGFYSGYDPGFAGPVAGAQREALAAMTDYAKVLRERVAGLPPQPAAPTTATPAGGRGGRGGRGGAPILRSRTTSWAIRSAATACSRISRAR